MRCRYPASLLKGGRILDVTAPPYGAVGDGKTDCTRAFVAAYDAMMTGLARAAAGNGLTMAPQLGAEWFQVDYSPILYIPDGIYLVSDTVIYSGAPRLTKNGVSEALMRIRVIGESREKTILRLQDHAAGFGPGSNKPVLSYGKFHFNHSPTHNVCRNLTIDTGTGNDGAVALKFAGANLNEIANVRLKGKGACGLEFDSGATQGYFHDLSLEGFDEGIVMKPTHATQLTFEHVTLKDQRIRGVRSQGSCATFRDLVYSGGGPALSVASPAALVVMVDAWLGGTGPVAIELGPGQLFARRVESAGYARVLQDAAGATLDEYVSTPPVVLGQALPEVPHSLALAVEEAPLGPELGPEGWANVAAFGAVGDGIADDSAAIERAMRAGKKGVLFPGKAYRLGHEVEIPAGVERVNLLFCTLFGSPFRIRQAGPEPLVVEDGAGVSIVHAANRPLSLRNLLFTTYTRAGKSGAYKLFASSCAGLSGGREGYHDQTVWFRQVNRENRQQVANFRAHDVTMWVLGFKSEAGAAAFEVQRARLEVLGGLINQPDLPGGWQSAFVTRDVDFSISAHTNLNGRTFQQLFTVHQGAQTFVAGYDRFPDRHGKPGEVLIPLALSSRATSEHGEHAP